MDKLSPLRQCEGRRYRKFNGGQLVFWWGCQPLICWCIDNTDIEERGPTLVAIMEVAECIRVVEELCSGYYGGG